jgi:hypothetical protein
MSTSNNDFGDALRKAEEAVKKDTAELQQETTEEKKEEADIALLKQELPALDKEREQKRHLLSLTETKLPGTKRKKAQTENRLRDENQKLQQAHRGSSEEMRRAGVRGLGLR